jgi:hypothetical protein
LGGIALAIILRTEQRRIEAKLGIAPEEARAFRTLMERMRRMDGAIADLFG